MGDTQYQRYGRRTARGPFARDARDQRRDDGDARNAAWRLLTPGQQLESLLARRGNSERQIRRIMKEATAV